MYDYDVKSPNLPFYGGREQYGDEFSFLFLKLNKILKNSTPGKSPTFDILSGSKSGVQIDAIKFERTQIPFFYRRFHCRRRPFLLKVPITE